jgi:hypothetical protein
VRFKKAIFRRPSRPARPAIPCQARLEHPYLTGHLGLWLNSQPDTSFSYVGRRLKSIQIGSSLMLSLLKAEARSKIRQKCQFLFGKGNTCSTMLNSLSCQKLFYRKPFQIN